MKIGRSFALLVGLLAVACTTTTTVVTHKTGSATPAPDDTSDQDPGDDTTPPPPAPTATTPPPPAGPLPPTAPDLPQVVKYQGGPTMTSARIVPITFAGDTYQATIDDFSAKVGAADFWSAETAEYGLKTTTAGTPVHLTEAPPAALASQQAVRDWLSPRLDGTHPEYGAPDSSALYAIFFPSTTTITMDDGGTSCNAFGGYHDSLKLPSGQNIVFAVMPRCAGFNGLAGADAVTGPYTHELVEAVTDPLNDDRAYAVTDIAHVGWSLLAGGEVGDMCAEAPGAFTKVPGFPYLIQRTWSNVEAKALRDPCVPHVSSSPFFAAAPEMQLVLADPQTTVEAVVIPVGQKKTINIDLLSSSASMGAFSITALDVAGALGHTPELSVQLGATSGKPGDKIPVTVTALAASPNGISAFVVVAGLASDPSAGSLWYGSVLNSGTPATGTGGSLRHVDLGGGARFRTGELLPTSRQTPVPFAFLPGASVREHDE